MQVAQNGADREDKGQPQTSHLAAGGSLAYQTPISYSEYYTHYQNFNVLRLKRQWPSPHPEQPVVERPCGVTFSEKQRYFFIF